MAAGNIYNSDSVDNTAVADQRAVIVFKLKCLLLTDMLNDKVFLSSSMYLSGYDRYGDAGVTIF